MYAGGDYPKAGDIPEVQASNLATITIHFIYIVPFTMLKDIFALHIGILQCLLWGIMWPK